MKSPAEYAQLQVQALGLPFSSAGLVQLELELCRKYDQVEALPGDGMIAWLRCEPEHLPLFWTANFSAVAALPRIHLRFGHFLFVVEILAPVPGSAYTAIRALGRLPGVWWIGGYRMNGTFHVKRTRQCPGSSR